MTDTYQLGNKQAFIKKVYTNLGLGLFVFTVLSFLFQTPALVFIPKFVTLTFSAGWLSLITFALFIGATFATSSLMESTKNRSLQYLGLFLYALLEVLFFSPVFLYASYFGIIIPAILITACTFIGLTLIVVFSKKDFTFLGKFLTIASFIAFALIVVSLIFGFNLGILFSGAMLLIACGFILYDTSNVLNRYSESQDIAAGGALLASVLLLFWYVIRFLIELSNILGE